MLTVIDVSEFEKAFFSSLCESTALWSSVRFDIESLSSSLIVALNGSSVSISTFATLEASGIFAACPVMSRQVNAKIRHEIAAKAMKFTSDLGWNILTELSAIIRNTMNAPMPPTRLPSRNGTTGSIVASGACRVAVIIPIMLITQNEQKMTSISLTIGNTVALVSRSSLIFL